MNKIEREKLIIQLVDSDIQNVIDMSLYDKSGLCDWLGPIFQDEYNSMTEEELILSAVNSGIEFNSED